MLVKKVIVFGLVKSHIKDLLYLYGREGRGGGVIYRELEMGLVTVGYLYFVRIYLCTFLCRCAATRV